MATKKINIAVNMYNFQWTFPEMVADELGLFKEHGLEANWRDITPSGLTDKGVLYTDLLESKKTDVYHAGEWVCILRVHRLEGVAYNREIHALPRALERHLLALGARGLRL